jgi:hypothetical protein
VRACRLQAADRWWVPCFHRLRQSRSTGVLVVKICPVGERYLHLNWNWALGRRDAASARGAKTR